MNLSRCCRGFVDDKNTSINRESIGQTKGLEKWLDGSEKLSRIYQEETQKSQWIENPSRSVEKRERKARQKEIYQGSVEKLLSFKKECFSRREKHKEMNATSKLLKQGSNQHIKLSKHLSTYKQSIHRSKTHIHTKQV